jgi:8-oxo-dGTP pyrophosphatase MutT (NUDIX family)
MDAAARLEAWTPPDDAQAGMRDGMLQHLLAHEDAMAKSGPPAHFTGSVIVLDESLSSVLLTHHRKARLWLQFGGHYEPGDSSVWQAAAREAREESGLAGLTVVDEIVHLDRHALVGDFGRCREHLDIRFAAIAPVGAEHAVSDESLDVGWWRVGALPPGSPDDLRPLVAAAVRALARPGTASAGPRDY